MAAEQIAVLAGTPVDTQMGADCLARAGLNGLAFPLASDPRQQTAFQISSPAEKTAAVRAVLEQAQEAARRTVAAGTLPEGLQSAVDALLQNGEFLN